MELRDYVRILQKSWILIAALLLVGVVAAAGYSAVQKPLYSSSAKVFVSTSGGSTAQDLQQGNTFTQQRVKTYADLATTPIVLLPVITELRLDLSSSELAAMITASAPLDTTLIEIAVTNGDPALAAQIATSTSESLTRVVEKIETSKKSAAAVSPVELTLVQHAEVPQQPISPNKSVNIAVGALLGLGLGLGLAIIRETLDNRVRNERDVELITQAPLLGGTAFDANASERPLIVHDDPRSPRAESFRTLRTNLRFLDVGRQNRAFVITSSIQGEGKSTSAVNLAIALADAGSRVLLVDADLRRPKIHEYLGLEGAVGLTDLLIDSAAPQDVIQPWGKRDLFVLPAGKTPPNPSELLGSDAMAELITEFNRDYDVVLFDSAPLLPVTDGAILARTVGGTIVVCAAGRTHKNQLKSAFSVLRNVDAPVSGVVLTMLPSKGPDAYGYGTQNYGYESGEPKAGGKGAGKGRSKGRTKGSAASQGGGHDKGKEETPELVSAR